MNCPHCSIHFHDNWIVGSIDRGTHVKPGGGRASLDTGWRYRTIVCPHCSKLTIELSPPLSRELLNEASGVPPQQQDVFFEGQRGWRWCTL